jgi:hypothetical protein
MKNGALRTTIFPSPADNTIRGMKFPVYLFTLIAIVSTVRSLIHIFSPDGGAGSIAGMDVSVEGAPGIIFAFALWGSSQLVYALVQLTVAFRYRSLIPAMYLLLAIETALRMLVGRIKPVTFAHAPPGAIGNYVILPLSLIMLALSLPRKTN